ncbi:hypothetical protein [Methylomagnum ishizawai]|uniref:hypothetical protein n=1 Tax=Methylomagnum ishizawai TaxID=1760988 RepID=UPI001C335D01|nr:hypothetical protein [Methylomagnum ishizawai]BBL77157.1 hypothetical protein MishRS11D_42550 [Methylomagnum ishizawai]
MHPGDSQAGFPSPAPGLGDGETLTVPPGTSPRSIAAFVPVALRRADAQVLNRRLAGTGFRLIPPPAGLATGRPVRLSGNSIAAQGLRIVVGLLADEVQALPSAVGAVLRALGPAILVSDVSNSQGRAWINHRLLAFGVSQYAKSLIGKASVDDLVAEAKAGTAYNIGSNDYRHYTPATRVEVIQRVMQNTIRHEIGHLLTSEAALDRLDAFMRSHGVDGAWTDRHLSPYAAHNGREFLAESFSKYHHRDYRRGTMPADWEALVEAMPGDKLAQLDRPVDRK